MSGGVATYANISNNTNPKWWKDAGLRANCARVAILYTAVYSLGYDGSLLNGLQALTPWQRDFNYPKGYSLGLIAATYYLPKIPIAFVVPWFCDKYGRKIPLYIAAVFMLAGAIAGGVARNRGDLMGSRVLLGVGTAFGQITACAMVPEIAHPRLRHMSGSFLNVTYFIGSIFAAWLTFAMVFATFPGSNDSFSWRVPNYIQGFGPLLLGIGTYFVPESPRWLIKNGKKDEAHAILARFHANGDLQDPLVQMELKEIEAAIAAEEHVKTSSWMTFFQTSGNRRRFFIIIMLGTGTQWVGNGILSYYLVPVLKQVGITAPAQTAGINGGLAIWQWICALSGAGSVERFGRRPIFLVSLSGMLACFIIMTGVSGGYAHTHVSATGIAIIPVIFAFAAFYAIAFTPIPILYVPEISPLSLRAKSAALLLLSQNVAQAFNQFVNPIALAAITWRYYIVYVAVLAIYLACFYFFLRETRGLTVEEAAVVYDPDDIKMAALEAEKHARAALEAAMAIDDKSSHKSDDRVDKV